MDNNLNQNQPQPDDWRKENIDPALKAAEDNILRAKFNNLPPAVSDFEERLKAQILEKRAAKRMSIFSSFKDLFSQFLRPRRWVPAVALVVLVAIVLSVVYWPGQDSNIFSGFSKLIISPAYAQDNFELKPIMADTLGASPDTAYVLTSKESLDAKLVKNNLKIEPAMAYDFKAISDKEWQIIPASPVEPNTIVKFTIAASYVGATGEQQERDYAWAYQIKDTFKVLTSIPRHAATGVPVESGMEVTFSHENFSEKDFPNYFSIEPKVEGRFEKHGRTMVFVPANPLQSGQVYTVAIKAGLSLAGSTEVLTQDYKMVFETDKPQPSEPSSSFSVYDKFTELNPQDNPTIYLYAQQVNELTVALYQYPSWQEYYNALKKRDELPWWSTSHDDYKDNTKNLRQFNQYKLVIKKRKLNSWGGEVSYVELPEKLPVGFYIAEMTDGKNKDQAWLQVSNLITYLNLTKTGSVMWVNSLATKTPVDNAGVEILGLDNKYKTDPQGVAKFTTPPVILDDYNNPDKYQRYYFRVSKDTDTLIMSATNNYRTYYYWDNRKITEQYWQYLYSDRPMYQPTDTIKYWGLLKNRNNQGLDKKATITLYKEGYVDYYYRPVKIFEQEVKVDSEGIFAGEIKIADLRPDYYTLELKVGEESVATKYINIQTYTKPAYQLTLIPDKKYAFADDQINLTAQASFFEGTPVPNLKLIFSTPKGEQEVTTDSTGKVNLSFTNNYSECQEQYSCWPSNAWLSVKPADPELAEITGEANLTYFGPAVYLNQEVKYPNKGVAEIHFATKKIDLNKMSDNYWWYGQGNDPAPNTRIDGEVIKITYVKKEIGTSYDFISKKSYKNYSYERQETPVENFSVKTDSNGEYIYRQAVEPETSYEVRLKYFDDRGRFDKASSFLYYFDGREVLSSNDEFPYYHLELPENKRYSVGEEVVASFKNNSKLLADGTNRYLYLQMQNGLQEYLVASGPEYRFKFEERDIPNVNLSGVYFDGDDYVLGQASYYYQGAAFDTKNKAMKISITTDKSAYRPGGEVELSVATSDKDNHPTPAQVNLNLIDEAFYAIADDTASPLESIYKNVGAGSVFERASHRSVPDLAMFGGAEKGGCFAAGTLISLADGSKKPIEKIKVGDAIKTFKDPVSLEIATGKVIEVYQHIVPEYLLINDKLKVTPVHLVYSEGQFKEAGSLKVGDWLLNESGKKVSIDSINLIKKVLPVYNFKVDPQHTYLAGGFYVHNEKGGGPRELFTDAALFQTVKTGVDGQAKIKFKLPDNITSWRVTSQGIGNGLQVGVETTKIPVSLPAFAEATIGNEYLVADMPVARMRSFGVNLKADDNVTFGILAPTLGINNPERQIAKAFQSVYFNLPDLFLGQHDVTYYLDSNKGNDSLKLPIKVIASRLEYQAAKNEKLTTATKVAPEGNQPLAVVLSDAGQNQFYSPLVGLSYPWTDRVDQKVAASVAHSLLSRYYQEKDNAYKFDAFNYQTSDGGIALLPYSSNDLELSARVTATSVDGFDKESLKQYFFRILEDRSSNREEISWSLSGLASLGEPVLPRIQAWLTRDDLSPTEKIYLAQAIYNLGAKEWAKQLYYGVMNQYAEKNEADVIVRVSNKQDEVFRATALAAVLAGSLGAPEAAGLWHYLTTNQKLYENSENLFDLEKANYLRLVLPQLKPGRVKVAYEYLGQRTEVDLTGGNLHSFQVGPTQTDQLKFVSVEGEAGISVRYVKPFDIKQAAKSKDVSIRREYYVDGKKTNVFKETDLIEVRLYPSFKDSALEGDYQITDYLPSGLMPVTKIYNRLGYYGDCHYWYPYDVSGQAVHYRISKTWRESYCGGDYIRYYVRAKNRGEYSAEPTILQNFVNPKVINYSNTETIKVVE